MGILGFEVGTYGLRGEGRAISTSRPQLCPCLRRVSVLLDHIVAVQIQKFKKIRIFLLGTQLSRGVARNADTGRYPNFPPGTQNHALNP